MLSAHMYVQAAHAFCNRQQIMLPACQKANWFEFRTTCRTTIHVSQFDAGEFHQFDRHAKVVLFIIATFRQRSWMQKKMEAAKQPGGNSGTFRKAAAVGVGAASAVAGAVINPFLQPVLLRVAGPVTGKLLQQTVLSPKILDRERMGKFILNICALWEAEGGKTVMEGLLAQANNAQAPQYAAVIEFENSQAAEAFLQSKDIEELCDETTEGVEVTAFLRQKRWTQISSHLRNFTKAFSPHVWKRFAFAVQCFQQRVRSKLCAIVSSKIQVCVETHHGKVLNAAQVAGSIMSERSASPFAAVHILESDPNSSSSIDELVRYRKSMAAALRKAGGRLRYEAKDPIHDALIVISSWGGRRPLLRYLRCGAKVGGVLETIFVCPAPL